MNEKLLWKVLIALLMNKKLHITEKYRWRLINECDEEMKKDE